MNTSSWARPGALTLACALSLALLTGCADGTDAKPSRAASSPAETAGASEPAARALSEKQLTTLALTDGDLPGYKITEPSERRIRAASRGKDGMKVAKICRPLLEADGVLGDPASLVVRAAAEIPGIVPVPGEDGKGLNLDALVGVDVSTIALTSYEGDGAQQIMKGLADALEACEGELSYTLPSRNPTTTTVTPRQAVEAERADDSVAFLLSARKRQGALPHRVYFQVVRHGSSLITYRTRNVAKQRDGKPYGIDAAVVAFQSKKVTDRLGLL